MIDIHAHILPSLDDGAETIEESIELCKIAANDGIKTIVATPHSKDGVYEAKKDDILKKVKTLNLKLKELQIDLEILPGSEIHINFGLMGSIKNGEVLTINDGGKFILLELPFMFIPPGTEKFIFDLKLLGIVSIISHAERITMFQRNPKIVEQLVKSGALVQVTAQSLLGNFGSRERKCVERLLKHKMVHFIASDTHSLTGRPPILSKAVEKAAKIIGDKEARALVSDNPGQIINGLDIN
ncbi:MAG: tyrosine-protein phosphatase [Candidatus Scalinduaceae bacterium]